MAPREPETASLPNTIQRMTTQRTASHTYPSPTHAPLLDTEWLLGPKPTRNPLGRWFVISTSIVAAVAACFVSIPRLSKAWLHQQFAHQYLRGTSEEARNEGIVGLAKLLPDSLDTIVSGFAVAEANQPELAYQALSHFLDQVSKLPANARRARQAEVAFALEANLPSIRDEALGLAAELAQQIRDDQKLDSHPATAVTLASCLRIAETAHTLDTSPSTTGHPSIAAPVPLIANQNPTHSQSHPKAPLADAFVSESRQISDRQPATPSILDRLHSPAIPTTSTVSFQAKTHPLAEERLADTNPTPTPAWNQSTSPKNSLTTNPSGAMKHKLLQAARRIAANDPPNLSEDSSFASNAARNFDVVVGIDRQNTRDLLQLLASSQSHLARAAFHELQRNRLSREELELAVELAKGNTVQKIESLDRLAANPNIDPIDWLSWMANESDRDVRFKAVSMLASLNNDQARSILKELSNRERDLEVGQHIQQALAANSTESALK